MKTILFQGDSVTDAGRNRADFSSLGGGYPKFAAEQLQGAKFLNGGLSGNRVKDLEARWQTDCLDLNPDVVSILIGINDVWRAFDSNDPTATSAYEAGLRRLLAPLQARNVTILLMTPFLIDGHLTGNLKDKSEAGIAAFHADADDKKAAMLRVASDVGALTLDSDEVFRASGLTASEFSGDGVHPTPAGHAALGAAVANVLRGVLA